MLVTRIGGDFLRRVVRAFAQQAMQEEHIEQPDRGCRDAHRLERVEVHQAHFHVLDAAFPQRMQRAFALPDHALGTDRAVELVFDLQQAGRELAVAVDAIPGDAGFADADRLIGRVRARQRVLQRGAVAVEAVVADGKRALCVALVAQRPHAQRRGMRAVHGAGLEFLELVLPARNEGRAHRGRGPEQVEQQPGMPPEIADQREVRHVRLGNRGEGEVVVDARDRLHPAAVPVRQPGPIDRFCATHVRAAVTADRDGIIARQPAGHARAPHHLVVDVAIDDLVYAGELFDAGFDPGVHAGDQFQLGFAEVGGDVRMAERRAESGGVRIRCECPVRPHSQAFLLDAATDVPQRGGPERAQSIL